MSTPKQILDDVRDALELAVETTGDRIENERITRDELKLSYIATAALAKLDSLELDAIYIGKGRNGWEFAYDTDAFTPGPESRPALLITKGDT